MSSTAPTCAFERASPLTQALVAEAVQRIEAAGPLDDASALRQALHSQPTRVAQVAARAWLLGERLGLPAELARWRQLALWSVLALAVLMALAALATARAVLAPDGSINAVAAFVSLLGWHTLMLLPWLAGLLWAGRGAGDLSLGRMALGLAARVPIERGPHALTLLHAAAAVLRRARLWPWLTGLLSHTIWALAFALMLALLAFGFAFHAYRLTWETTILSAEFFQRFVAATGALPAWLGFAVPDAAAVQQVGNAAQSAALPGAGQREWAWWLMGCVFTYGLLPRVLLAAFSGWRWRAGQARLAVDMADPEVRRIAARLAALEPPPQVIDAEHRPDAAPPWAPTAPPGAPGTLALIGFELPPEVDWPPAGLLQPTQAARIAGSARERESVLTSLAAARPAALLLALHASASPDRGTARFLREAAAQAGRAAVLLLTAGAPAPEGAARRWREWLDSEGFEALVLMDQAQAAIDWIVNDSHG